MVTGGNEEERKREDISRNPDASPEMICGAQSKVNGEHSSPPLLQHSLGTAKKREDRGRAEKKGRRERS
jgi:hypothetical protein